MQCGTLMIESLFFPRHTSDPSHSSPVKDVVLYVQWSHCMQCRFKSERVITAAGCTTMLINQWPLSPGPSLKIKNIFPGIGIPIIKNETVRLSYIYENKSERTPDAKQSLIWKRCKKIMSHAIMITLFHGVSTEQPLDCLFNGLFMLS